MGSKMYDVHLRIVMPDEVSREGQPTLPVTAEVVSGAMERMLRDQGVDLIFSSAEEVMAFEDDED